MIIDPYTWQRVIIRRVIRESTHAVTLEVDRPRDYDYSPGQHAIMRLPLPGGQTIMRQYSYASAPFQPRLTFTIVQTPHGTASTWCNQQAHVGDTIEISQAFSGPLCHDFNQDSRYLMIAGGSGIAPLMSHIRQLRQATTPTSFTLLYSTRRDRRCFTDELAPRPSETIIVHCTDTAPRLTPRDIHEYVPTATVVMICGSRGFVETMESSVKTLAPDLPILSEAFSL